ncbi:MAG: CHASE2 domain-containing protein, partial [Pseudomonadota bacterium]
MARSTTPSLRFAVLIPLAVVLGGLLVAWLEPIPVLAIRHAVFDQFQRWQPRTYQEAPVHIVDIDEASLAQLGQWPWPRDRLAVLVDRLRAAGAAAIVFDVAFVEPDRTSPSALARVWPLDPSGRRLLATLPEPDQVFAEALAKGGVVLAFPLDTVPTPKATSEGPARFVVAGPPTLAALPDFPGLVPVLPGLAGAAAGLGAMTFRPDADGVLRRVPLVLSLDGQPVPGLAAEALRVAQGARNYVLRTDPAGLVAVRIGALEIPTTPAGEVWLHYSPPVPGRSLSAWRVMAGELDHEVRGRIVLIGSSAQGLMDLRFSPLGGVIPGVEVHAQALEQSLAGLELHRPAWVEALELAILVVAGFGVGAAALSLGALPATGVALVVLV